MTAQSDVIVTAPPTLHGMLDHAANTKAHATALIDERGCMTYQELRIEVDALTAGLRASGWTAGDRVALWLPNSRFWLELHMSLMNLGAVVIGINARYPVAEVVRIIRTSNVTAIAVDPTSVGLADAHSLEEITRQTGVHTVISATTALDLAGSIRELTLAELVGAGHQHKPVPHSADGRSVFASSGSTGDPKLIVHGQKGIAAHSIAVAEAYGYVKDGTVVLCQLPFCGVWGFNTAYAALAAAAPMVLMQRFEAAAALRLINDHGVTHANGPDLFLRQLFSEAEKYPGSLASLREIGFSTFSNDSAELVEWGDRLGLTLFQLYGSSEQQALMVRRPADGTPEERALPGGRPCNPETRMRIRDVESGTLAAPGDPGVLETAGPNVMLGYLQSSGLNTSSLVDGEWVSTGDIGRLTPSGFEYLTRDKDALRLSGFLVDPREIEIILEELTGIAEAKVVGIETVHGPRCVAFVLTDPSQPLDELQVLHHLRTQLASYKIPQRVFEIEDFPRVDGANGPRIQRLALRELAAERFMK
jgi:fatty-acyl-CoA synthase